MKNNVCIFNYNWDRVNYGAILTAYALQQFFNDKLVLKNFLVNNPQQWHELFYFNKKTFNIFKEKYFTTTNLLKLSDIIKLNKFFNNFIVGSDQVFRPKYLGNYLWQYMLDFVDLNKKKIAFSASFGVDKEKFLQETSKEKIEHMKNSLKSFDCISVREKSGVEICRDLFDVKAEWIIDPVFILDRNKWYELIENADEEILKQVQNDVIVSYVLDTNKEYKKVYKYLEKQHNASVIELANSNESVENWLKAIRDCKFLITDSFHGMCFAIIFNKPFICLANKKRGATRFESILEMLNIDYQCIDSVNEIYKKDCIFKVDYDVVNKCIGEERQRGLDFLKKALEAPVQVTPEKVEARMKFLENKVCELEQQANLKYQIQKELWNLWLVIFHKYLPEFVKNIIRNLRGRKN